MSIEYLAFGRAVMLGDNQNLGHEQRTHSAKVLDSEA